jgi:hypothetical protein
MGNDARHVKLSTRSEKEQPSKTLERARVSVRATGLLPSLAAVLLGAMLPAQAVAGMHASMMHPPMPHAALPHSMPAPMSTLHSPATEPSEHAASHPPAATHSSQPQAEPGSGRRLFLPWWFRRRHIAAPELPLV